MAQKKNKVKFGLNKVHYAKITGWSADDVPTFAPPVRIPGAVSLSMDVNGENENFFADNSVYYVINNNAGYTGDLEIALIPESFRTGILNETSDSNNVLVENSNSQVGHFALLFEFDGDQKKIRHVLYNCSASRPSIASKTNEASKEVQTEKLTIKARPLANGLVKAKSGDTTKATAYNNWYKAVYQPDAVGGYDDETTDETTGA